LRKRPFGFRAVKISNFDYWIVLHGSATGTPPRWGRIAQTRQTQGANEPRHWHRVNGSDPLKTTPMVVVERTTLCNRCRVNIRDRRDCCDCGNQFARSSSGARALFIRTEITLFGNTEPRVSARTQVR